MSARNNKELIKAVEMLVLANHDLQEKMSTILKNQEKFAQDLKAQQKELKTETQIYTCIPGFFIVLHPVPIR